jgi:hypothetical protein
VILSRVTAYFAGNRLISLDGGDMPNEKNYLALIAGSEAAPPPPPETDGLNSPKKDKNGK